MLVGHSAITFSSVLSCVKLFVIGMLASCLHAALTPRRAALPPYPLKRCQGPLSLKAKRIRRSDAEKHCPAPTVIQPRILACKTTRIPKCNKPKQPQTRQSPKSQNGPPKPPQRANVVIPLTRKYPRALARGDLAVSRNRTDVVGCAVAATRT